jgi:hypothetical protein
VGGPRLGLQVPRATCLKHPPLLARALEPTKPALTCYCAFRTRPRSTP